jgi:transcriptional regulator with XRE-family HTH domain
MSLKDWEGQVLAEPGAAERVAEIEDELRIANGLTALREQAGLSQRDLAKRAGVSQPRVAAIERSSNVTVALLARYVRALGGDLRIQIVSDGVTIPLVGAVPPAAKKAPKRR